MPDQADTDLQSLTRLRVMHLERTTDARHLAMRWAYYEARQHDDAPFDFDFRARQRGLSYMRQRALGYTDQQAATAPNAPVGQRRPSNPSSLIGEIVDTYTAALLGPNRRPTVSVIGDPDSTTVLQQLFAGSWDHLVEVRKWAGAQGCAALLPMFVDGKVSIRGIRAQDLHVEWSTAPSWVPRMAIEQKLVEVRSIDPTTGEAKSGRVWRTRAWDERYAYEYKDVPESFGAPKDDKDIRDEWIELAGPPIEHKAGRCPVVWLPNTCSSEDPFGEPDVPDVSCEQADQLDILWSMIVRGTKANNDPTLVIKDRLIERRMWPMRAKGHGNKIEVSEVGDAHLLEMSGKTIETSLLVTKRIEEMIESRTGHVVVKPDQAGAMQSGVALQILGRTQANRIAVRRGPLGSAIVQIAGILLSFTRAVGIKGVGEPGPGIELAPVRVESEGEEDEDGCTFEMPKLGKGRAIQVTWGELHSPTPTDLQALAQSSTLATGGRPVVSQRTAVGLFASLGQTGVDPETELERMHEEAEARVASFESSMTPEADKELEDAMKKAEGGEAAPDQQGGAPVAEVQKQALNGAQQQQLVATLAQAGIMLDPETTLFALLQSFPDLDETAARAAIDAQLAFAKQRASEQPAEPVNQSAAPAIEGA